MRRNLGRSEARLLATWIREARTGKQLPPFSQEMRDLLRQLDAGR
jgi:hypothetical protein